MPYRAWIVVAFCAGMLSAGDNLGFGDTTAPGTFFDNFLGESLAADRWLNVSKAWGSESYTGGVDPANVAVRHGDLVVEAHGNLYTGDLPGPRGMKVRVGGAVNTKRLFGSGSFEVKAKICPQVGALSCFWTFYWESADYNHEIDFEMPGNDGQASNLEWGLCTAWRGENAPAFKTVHARFPNQNDGNYHLYRIEWHTGTAPDSTGSVEWYYDNVKVVSNNDPRCVPNHAGNFWLGIWFPTWIGVPDFGVDSMLVDWVKIVPYGEANDVGADPVAAQPRDVALQTRPLSLRYANARIEADINVTSRAKLSLTLFDLRGQQLLRREAVASPAGPDHLSLTVGALPPGVYLWRMAVDDRSRWSGRLSVVK
jgi:beta-glucanase (GH16 family)